MRFRNQKIYKIIYCIQIPTLDPLIQVYGYEYHDKKILKKQIKLLNLMYTSLDHHRLKSFTRIFRSNSSPEDNLLWMDRDFTDWEYDYLSEQDIFVEGSTIESRGLFWEFGREMLYLSKFPNGKMFNVVTLHR